MVPGGTAPQQFVGYLNIVSGQETIAQFVTNFIAGKIETVGP